MHIGIDARMYGPRQGGIGRYIEQLIQHLQKIDLVNQYIIFLRTQNFTDCVITNNNFTKVKADIPWYTWREQYYFPKIIQQSKLDLMHFPHWNVPLLYRKKFIVTVHDLIMYHFPRADASTRGKLNYWLRDKAHRLILSSATTRATHIIATSAFTKQDIIKELNIKTEKISVTYQAPFTPISSSHVSSASVPTPTYALYVGTSYPHKNLTNLLRAWQKIEKQRKDISLILTGRKNYFYERLLNTPEFKNCHSVRYEPDPDDQTLINLYRSATVFIFPSMYEGFGLPPLEAMAHRVPVVAANCSCLPEILQNAAWYFDPTNTEDMARKILLALNNQNLRATLKKNSAALLMKYSWEKLARETISIYQTVDNSSKK